MTLNVNVSTKTDITTSNDVGYFMELKFIIQKFLSTLSIKIKVGESYA